MSEVKRAGFGASRDTHAQRAGLLATAEAIASIRRDGVKTVLLFGSGSHAKDTGQLARGAIERLPHATVVALGGVGALAPGLEVVGETAVVALALPFPITVELTPPLANEVAAREAGRRLGEAMSHPRRRPVAFFCRPSPVSEAAVLGFFDGVAPTTPVVGGGLGNEGLVAVGEADQPLREGHGVGIRFDGGMRIAIGASPGVRRISDWLVADDIVRGFVRRLGDRRPLDVLTEAVNRREPEDGERPLVMIVKRPTDAMRPGEGLVRPITGVDSRAGAVHLGEAVQSGDEIAFAALDGPAAREDFAGMLRQLEGQLNGGAALAGLFVDCAGRGHTFYGRPHVDTKAITRRFSGLPFIGIRSSFEIAPFDGTPEIQSYTGVFAVLYAPS